MEKGNWYKSVTQLENNKTNSKRLQQDYIKKKVLSRKNDSKQKTTSSDKRSAMLRNKNKLKIVINSRKDEKMKPHRHVKMTINLKGNILKTTMMCKNNSHVKTRTSHKRHKFEYKN